MDIEALYDIFRTSKGIATDSRKVTKRQLFFALQGENTDGNLFASQAIARGASCAVIDNPQYAQGDKTFLVDNALEALQQLANHHRKQFYIPIIAITGSNGKTTTKELVSAVLREHYETHATQGNFNNHIGVPLTLLDMPDYAEVAVIEMGANHINEITTLCEIAEPTHGLITNIGKAHIGEFGGIEGVKRAKAELYRYLAKQNGMVFVNADEPYLTELATANRKKLFYTYNSEPDINNIPIEVKHLQSQPFVSVSFLSDSGEEIIINSRLIGEYNCSNIMTAIALGKYFKVPSEKIKTAIEQYQPSNNRSQLLTVEQAQIILDAYNANPSSMRAALQNLANTPTPQIAILGEMRELGIYSAQEHEDVLAYAQSFQFHAIATIGTAFEKASKRFDNIQHFADAETLKWWLQQQTKTPVTILIKGSRGLQLESLLS